MSITTKKGDTGHTDLLFGRRVPKCHARIKAVGAVDELNVQLGGVKILLPKSCITRAFICDVQRVLVGLMGELTVEEQYRERYEKSAFHRLKQEHLDAVEKVASDIEARQPTMKDWAYPGSSPLEMAFEQARVAARRAERHIVDVNIHHAEVPALILQYINRLSDCLWLLARQTADQNG